MIKQCGNANPKGNIALFYKGGCKKELKIKDAYRCVGCGGWFHKECILKHFELEKEHDFGRNDLKQSLLEEGEKIKKDGFYLESNTDIENQRKIHDDKKYNQAIDDFLTLIKKQ